MKIPYSSLVVTGALLCYFTLDPQCLILAQGNLAPGGPPAPTMKSLGQIEPRTLVAAIPFTINTSGSYYLTANLTADAVPDGFVVNADDVTIDLNGFTLAGGTGSGVRVSGSHTNLVVRGGMITAWEGAGVSATTASGAHYERLRLSGNGIGLQAGANSAVQDCTAVGNTGAGIIAGNGACVRNCVASANGAAGITTGSGSIVKDCTLNGNSGSGIVTDRSTVTGCTAWSNQGDGIMSGIGSSIVGNTCRANNANEIHITGTNNRVDGNNATAGAGAGSGAITVDVGGNFIARNSAMAYNITGVQAIGPIVSTSGTITSSSPWANFQFP